MQTWQQFINEQIKNNGGDPEKIEASDYSPSDLEFNGIWSDRNFSYKSVWTDTHVYTFVYYSEFDVYRCVSARRNPSPVVSDEPAVSDEDVVVQVVIREVHENTVEFSVPRQGDTESLQNFEQRCREEAESRQGSQDSVNLEFSRTLDQESWSVENLG